MSFIDWNDQNAHAAAESAVRLMGDEGYGFADAIKEAAHRYSAPPRDVSRWVRRLAGGERRVGLAEDLPAEWIAAVRNAQVPE